MSPFPTQIDEIAFLLLYVIWILLHPLERIVIWRSARDKTKVQSDRGSFLLIFGSIFLSITIAFTFAYAGVMILPAWVFYVGLTLMGLGIIVREWAVVTLRKFFSYTVRIREKQSLVQNGPYKFVRHPAYSGTMLTVIGLAIALRSLAGVLVLLTFCSVAYTYRIIVEEKLLREQLGQAYVEYMKSTKRLIPFLL